MQAATQPEPKGNDAAGYERIFRENHDLVLRTAFRVTGNTLDAEDVLQTVFLRLIRREMPIEFKGGAQGYLHRAAVNAALDVVRTRGRNVSLEEVQRVPKDPAAAPDQSQSDAEVRAWLRTALAALNRRAAEIFVLYYLEGYSYPEITRMLKMSRGTVAVILYRTRRRLRRELSSFLGGKS